MANDYPKLKDHPRLKTLLARVSPNYRKHTVILVEQDQVSCHNSAWDGGSRTYYAVADKHGSNVESLNTGSAPAHFGGPKDPVVVDLAGDVVVVSGGTFCGNKATAFVYANADTISWLQAS